VQAVFEQIARVILTRPFNPGDRELVKNAIKGWAEENLNGLPVT
jgi:hypothetical protein